MMYHVKQAKLRRILKELNCFPIWTEILPNIIPNLSGEDLSANTLGPDQFPVAGDYSSTEAYCFMP